MPVINRIAEFYDDMAHWRQQLHRRPELGLECHETAAFVAERLREFGVDEIDTGWAKTGVIGVIHGRGAGPVIGLRADMDALPIAEATGAPHASVIPGKMHACGHDGHTTMLLGAAKYLAETRNFAGSVALVFQPAEETEGGAGIMCNEGVLERFGIERIFALHSLPGKPVGDIVTCPGPIMAAVDDFEIVVTGQGGHAASAHETIDPIPAMVQIYQSLQTLVTRGVDPLSQIVLSATQMQAGTATNVVPDTARLAGTLRTFDADLRDWALGRLRAMPLAVAEAFGCQAEVTITVGYPATINDHAQTDFALSVAAEVVGADRVTGDEPPTMGAEDFAFFLGHIPGAYLYIGNGDSAVLHHPAYDFNDEAAPVGASLLARLVEKGQPAK